MSISPDHFASTTKAAIDSLQAISNTTLSSLEKLISLNIASLRSLVNDQVDHAKSLSGAKDIQEVISLNSSQIQPGAEKLISYSRSVYDISNETQEEFIKVLESQQSEVSKAIDSLLDTVSKNSSGSEIAVAAVKSALSAANSTFENVNKAARQIAGFTEAGVNAAVEATTQAANLASSATSAAAASTSSSKRKAA